MPAVEKLWGQNRTFLGPFPKGAFEYYAKKNGLWAALQGESVVGYVSFRISRHWVRIAHLCVDTKVRGEGVADKLLAHVKLIARERTTDGIQLKCRRDYEKVKRLWIRNGFTSVRDVPGRGKDAALLTIWAFALERDDLFSRTEEPDNRLLAVVDANVFYDLHSRIGGQGEETRYLREPWVEDALELAVTNILHIEINEGSDASERERLHNCMSFFRELTASEPTFSAHQASLRRILGWSKPTQNQEADIRHLATAAWSEADIFVTRDQALLDVREEIQNRFGLRVMAPSQVILELDETENTRKYQPARLAGTSVTVRALKAADISIYAEQFRSCECSEPLNQLKHRLRKLTAAVRSTETPCDTRIAFDEQDRALAIFSSRSIENRIELLLFRLARKHNLASTLGRHVLLQAIAQAARTGASEIRITDSHLSLTGRDLISELHFAEDPKSKAQLRPIIRFIGSLADAEPLLVRAGFPISPRGNTTPHMVGELEARFWPLKILGEGVFPFIVPIRANWARGLFDGELASQELFHTSASLALNRTNVYYRAARPAGPKAPGRILWYISEDQNVAGSKAVRACSRLLHVEKGPAKQLYRTHEHLGIYSWKEILATARGEANGEIMIMLFADTEQFRRPVPLEFLRQIGADKRLVSPSEVSDDQFERIYRYGMTESQ